MTTGNEQAIKTLNHLTQLCLASERGFNVSAENVNNRGLKVLLKTFAQQRSTFAEALQAEVRRLGGSSRVTWKPLASLHRGWINIKAAMTVGDQPQERVVLAEAQRGERIALRNYQSALNAGLPPETRALVAEQAAAVERVAERVRRLRGDGQTKVVVRLFDTESDATRAIDSLTDSGIAHANIETQALREAVEVYDRKHKGHTVHESAGAGTLVGAGLGAGIGLIIGLGLNLVPAMGIELAMGGGVLVIAVLLLGLAVGALFGALIGATIGLAIMEDDSHRYEESVDQGGVLMLVEGSPDQAQQAWRIMQEVNATRRQTSLAAAD